MGIARTANTVRSGVAIQLNFDPNAPGASQAKASVPLADRPLQKILRRIKRTQDFPTISKYIIEINQKLAEDSNQSSASELANIILKDYALTNKLLKLVNSAFYGLEGGKVTTVTRAVVVLGYDQVRLATLSLLLFEHFKGKSGVRDLKDAAISSFWCGLIAREIARMESGIEPEEAFICALLHQLGKLLTIYHLPQEYREIRYRVTQLGEKERAAVKQVLGISYATLGLAVARLWNFPERVLDAMTPLSVEALEDRKRRLSPVCVLANFTNALCRIIDTVDAGHTEVAIKDLLDRYQLYITISARQLRALMRSSMANLLKHAEALQFSVDKSAFLPRLSGINRQARDRGDDRSLAGAQGSPPEAQASFRLAGGDEVEAMDPGVYGEDTVSIIMGGVQEVSRAMLGSYEINDIALMSLEIIYRALECQRALLFIHDGRNQLMEARFGYGTGIQPLVGTLRFATAGAAADDLFSQALKSGKDLIVADAGAPDLFPLLPPWYSQNLDAQAFLFMPVTYQKICVAAYYVDRDTPGPPVDAREHKYLSMLRNQLTLAIKMSR
jgi:eukaryotic-like serine/threonine-protein kinase